MLGYEFSKCQKFSVFERMYIWIFGMPILGLRIRAWRMLPLIKKYAAAAHRVLDFGSGRGVFTVEMAKYLPQAQVIGVDNGYAHKVAMADEVIHRLKLNNCQLISGDVFQRDFPQAFDCIVAIDVLEHIRDDHAMVQRLHELLAPGGRFIVHVPNYYRHAFGKRYLNFKDIEGHERLGYLPAELAELFQQAGFTMLESGYTYASLETIANDISYLITGGRERRKVLYSFAFPFLLGLAWLGKGVIPRYGSGLYAIGQKGEGHDNFDE